MEKVLQINLYPRNYLSREVITKDAYGYPLLTRFYSGENQTGSVMFEWLQTNSTSGIINLIAVKSKDVLTPPGTNATGDRYWIGGVGTGEWATKDYQIAEWDGTAWVYTAATAGNTAYVTDLGITFTFDGTSLLVFKEGIVLKWSVQNINVNV